jgi:hypothetical protein
MVEIKNGHPSVTIVYLLFSILGAILAEALYTSRGSEVPSIKILYFGLTNFKGPTFNYWLFVEN